MMYIIKDRSQRCISRIACVFAVAAVFCCAANSAFAFTITQWDIGVGFYGDGADNDFSVVVENPFQTSQFAQQPGYVSSAAAQYDFAWAEDFGHFLANSQLVAKDGVSNFSSAGGAIRLYTETDLLVQFDGAFNYNLPGFAEGATLGMSVRDENDQGNPIFSEARSFFTDLQCPLSGTANIAGSAILPAGHTYWLRYSLSVTVTGSSFLTATGDGYANIIISPAPEPASLALLVPFLFLLPRRIRR